MSPTRDPDLPGLLDGLDLIRKDFPILSRTMADGQPLVYLDSANTSQKPQVVIDTMVDHLERHNANIARAMHQLGAESTEAFEGARDKVATFLNARSRNEVIFTKNATEALNLLARTIDLGPGDNVVITAVSCCCRYDSRPSAPTIVVRSRNSPIRSTGLPSAYAARRRPTASKPSSGKPSGSMRR